MIVSRTEPHRSQEPNLFPRLRLHFADFPYLHAIAPSARGYSLRRPVAVISYGQNTLKGIVPNRTFKHPEPCPLLAGNSSKIELLCRDGRLLHGVCAKWPTPRRDNRATSLESEPPSGLQAGRGNPTGVAFGVIRGKRTLPYAKGVAAANPAERNYWLWNVHHISPSPPEIIS